MFQNGHAQNLENCVETGLEIEALLDDGDEHVDRGGDPDLGFDGVLGGAEEAFDLEVLLDPFEEEFDLPAAFVEPGDSARRQARYRAGCRDRSVARRPCTDTDRDRKNS